MNYVSNAGVFLIQTIFGLYALIVMLRLLLQVVRADFYNPISQFLVKATSTPLRPLRRFIPGYAGIDFAAVVLLLILKLVEITLISLFPEFPTLAIGGALALAVVELLKLLINVYIFGIIIMAVLSWVSPGTYNPVAGLLHQLMEPVLRPFRRLLPPMGGLDLTPLIALIALWLVMLLFIAPLQDGICSLSLFNSTYCRARLL
ncbi:YggT family protein [Thiohalophilus thiocyanatoxydans]|uniref:YggT family protein n=1 Tax=Thiohalophilus thiocyanatoxydans TaxID=381308 RepID=A0A4R8IUP1_9GAMM|nr:YggT family protein [Thiohalophilus thiocyanatoxydans]TDY04144.1 YggT family protein [Thiohalophilus thiocyanatoxydans]